MKKLIKRIIFIIGEMIYYEIFSLTEKKATKLQ